MESICTECPQTALANCRRLNEFNSTVTLDLNQLIIYVWIYFWALDYVPLVYVSIFMPVSYYFHYYTFLMQFDISKYDVFSFALLAQKLLWLFEVFWFHIN